MYLPPPNIFPAEHLPPLIRNAVLEMQGNTRFPLPLIVSSALGAMSLACQNSIDVQPPVGSASPCSLFMLLVADSGEGKTPSDHYFTKPIRDFEENEARKSELALSEEKAYRSTWEIEFKVIKAAIEKNRKKSLAADKTEQINRLNVEFESLRQKLQAHLSKEPRPQPKHKLLHSNTTPAKIALDLYENWPSAGLISDEAGSLLRGETMRDLGLLNQLWDGTPLTVDRISSPSFTVRDARLTVSLMVQGMVLDNYLKGRGKEARDIGLIARCLIALPCSTKGSRMVNNQSPLWDHLTAFQQRITAILMQDRLDVAQGRQTRRILAFSQEAKNRWIDFRNNIEFDLNAGRYLAEVDDGASKMATNLARMAALFHFFEGRDGEISAETLDAARSVCAWYMHEFKRIFTKNPEIPIEVSDANDLTQSLLRWCQNHPGTTAIQKSYVAQYGPSQLRRNRHRRETALNALVSQNKIQIQRKGKTQWVEFNPDFFPIPRSTHPQFPRMPYSINTDI